MKKLRKSLNDPSAGITHGLNVPSGEAASTSIEERFVVEAGGARSRHGAEKMKKWTSAGLGPFGEFQRQVNRMFRAEDDKVRSLPHVIHVEDIFRGLSLDSEAEGKLKTVVANTRFDFGAESKLRVPRVVHARIALMDSMRAMKQIDSTTRMEILRRAMAYWKRNGMDYNQPASIRYVAKSSNARDTMKHVFLMKGGKNNPYRGSDDEGSEEEPQQGQESYEEEGDDFEASGHDEMPGEGGEDEEGGDPQGKTKKGKDGKGGPTHPKDRRAGGDFASLPPDQQVQLIEQAVKEGTITEEEGMAALDEVEQGQDVDQPVVSAVEAMIEHEVDGGRMLDFGNGVQAHIPDDADFHHHATEYAKHRAGFQINKDKDPAVADAHKHAANIHASIGNAMHQAGDLERRRLPGSDGSGKAEMHQAALEQTEAGAAMGANPNVGEPEDLPMPGGPLGTNGPGGGPPQGGGGKPGGGPPNIPSPRDDIAGGPQPGMPDMKRNAPGADSEIASAQKMAGKLRSLVGKMTGKQEPVRGYPHRKNTHAPVQRPTSGRGTVDATLHEVSGTALGHELGHSGSGDIRTGTRGLPKMKGKQRGPKQAPQPRVKVDIGPAEILPQGNSPRVRIGPAEILRGKAGRALTAGEQSVAREDAKIALRPEYDEPMTGKQKGAPQVTRAIRGIAMPRKRGMNLGEATAARSSTSFEGRIAEVQRRMGWGTEGRRTTASGDERANARGIRGGTVRGQEMGKQVPPPQPGAKRGMTRGRTTELPTQNIRGSRGPAPVQLAPVQISARPRPSTGGQRRTTRQAPAAQAPAQPAAQPSAPSQGQPPAQAAPQAPAQAAAPAQPNTGARGDFRARLDSMVGRMTKSSTKPKHTLKFTTGEIPYSWK